MNALLTDEAAAQLGIKAATLVRYIARGNLKATKRGGRWYITDAECARFADERQVGPGNKTGQPRTKTSLLSPTSPALNG